MSDFKPFRWDVSRREQLPKIIDHLVGFPDYWPQVVLSPKFDMELRLCAARVIAAAGDTDWVFVGRSPEHLFDYLSGVFQGVAHAPSLTHLLVSMSGGSPHRSRENPAAFAALASYFATEGLDPKTVASRSKAVAFIDVVASGLTFGRLVGCLKLWNDQHRGDWNAVQRRLRFVGITARSKTSPKTWRWQQHQDWLASVPDAKVKNVSVPEWMFQSMGGAWLPKLTPSHTINRWDLLRGGGPPRRREQLAAVQLACRLYDLGRNREERLALASAISRLPDMRHPWLRTLVLKLRQKSRKK